MKEFKVGDEVIALEKQHFSNIPKGSKGIVRIVSSSRDENIGIEFYNPVKGHNLGNKLTNKQGWWMYPSVLKHKELSIINKIR